MEVGGGGVGCDLREGKAPIYRMLTKTTMLAWTGWCRTEAIARLLSAHSGPMIKLISADRDPELVPPFEAWLFKCGHGEVSCLLDLALIWPLIEYLSTYTPLCLSESIFAVHLL